MDSNPYAPRIYQLAADGLDQQLKHILTDILNKALTTIGFRGMRNELELFVNFIYFRLTIVKDKPLPAHIVENIGYASKDLNPLMRKQKLLYFVLMVLLPYGWKRILPKLEENYSNMIKGIEFVTKSVVLFYFLYFLSGRTPIPNDIRLWLAGIAVIQPKVGLSRELDFSVLNRTMIWEAIGGVLKTVLGSSLVQQIGKLFMLTSIWGSLSQEEEKGCPICREPVCVMPTTVEPCKHQFCYYCFANGGYQKCPKCQSPIESQLIQ